MTEVSAGAPATLADPFGLVGTHLDGKYAVEAVVAEGGFAVVYRCAHAGLQKTVALKVLKIPLHQELSARGEFFRKFANEARTIARIEHEAIVRVLDFGSTIMPTGELAPWMALEWLDGRTLERDLDQRAQAGAAWRSPAECLALLQPVIEAVALAHEEGVAHRDIKPGNLMLVTSRRGEERLKLLDFGIAKAMTDADRAPTLGQTATQAHLQMFSLDYAAPEQMSGTRTGPWTDVHALSLVLTEMLTGERPYGGDDSVEIFAEALSRQRPTPGRRGLDVGPWEAVLERSLALRPSDRYPDAGAFLAALLADVPERAVWRDASGETPAAGPVIPAVEPAESDPGRVTDLLPAAPARDAPYVDDDPVQLPVHRVAWGAWAAAVLGLAAVVLAVIVAQRPAPSRSSPPRPRPTPAATPPAPVDPSPPRPAAVDPSPPRPAAVAPSMPDPSPAPSPAVAAPPVAPPPPRAAPRRSPVRRVRAPRPPERRIPIE